MSQTMTTLDTATGSDLDAFAAARALPLRLGEDDASYRAKLWSIIRVQWETQRATIRTMDRACQIHGLPSYTELREALRNLHEGQKQALAAMMPAIRVGKHVTAELIAATEKELAALDQLLARATP